MNRAFRLAMEELKPQGRVFLLGGAPPEALAFFAQMPGMERLLLQTPGAEEWEALHCERRRREPGFPVDLRLDDFPSSREEPPFDEGLYALGRVAEEIRAALATAFFLLKPGGLLAVYGANEEGIKSLPPKALPFFGPPVAVRFRHSSRLFLFRKAGLPEAAQEEAARTVREGYFAPRPLTALLRIDGGERSPLPYQSRIGLFSRDGTDPGSALLLDHFPDCRGLQVLDLGCGSGLLTRAARLAGAQEVHALDHLAKAVRQTEENMPEARVHLLSFRQALSLRDMPADAATASAESAGSESPESESVGPLAAEALKKGLRPASFDRVVSNPPFHAGGEVDRELPDLFCRCCRLFLKPAGTAFLVANSFLPYREAARAHFDTVETLHRDPRYALYRLANPFP